MAVTTTALTRLTFNPALIKMPRSLQFRTAYAPTVPLKRKKRNMSNWFEKRNAVVNAVAKAKGRATFIPINRHTVIAPEATGMA